MRVRRKNFGRIEYDYMNWYHKIIIADTVDPIRYIEYNPDIDGWNMKVRFRGSNKVYTYKNVSPFIHESIEKLRRNKNYSKVSQILARLSENTQSTQNIQKKSPDVSIQYTNIVWGESAKDSAASFQKELPRDLYIPKVTKDELDSFGLDGVIEGYLGVKPESFDHEIKISK